MTSDEVLLVMQDVWRMRNGIDPDDGMTLPLNRECTIEKAANFMGLPKLADSWSEIAALLQRQFKVEFPSDIWKSATHPTNMKTLGPVCDLIAEQALAPLIERTAGGLRLNWQAAAFRTLLLVLNETPMTIAGIEPKSPLSPHVRRHFGIFAILVPRIAPGRMPAIRHKNVLKPFVIVGAIAIIALFILSSFLPVILARVIWVIWPWMCFAECAAWFLMCFRVFSRPQICDLRTFYDLCYALTSPPPDVDQSPVFIDGVPLYWDHAFHPLGIYGGEDSDYHLYHVSA